MCDQRPDVSLPLDLDNHSNGDDAVQLRGDSDTLRRIRDRKKERTPTRLVSEAFTFLNDHQISIVDAVDEGCLQTDENLQKCFYGEECLLNSSVTESTAPSDHLHSDKCLPQAECHFSEDSGFASLERHLHNDFMSLDVYEDEAQVDDSASHNFAALSFEKEATLDCQISGDLHSGKVNDKHLLNSGENDVTYDHTDSQNKNHFCSDSNKTTSESIKTIQNVTDGFDSKGSVMNNESVDVILSYLNGNDVDKSSDEYDSSSNDVNCEIDRVVEKAKVIVTSESVVQNKSEYVAVTQTRQHSDHGDNDKIDVDLGSTTGQNNKPDSRSDHGIDNECILDERDTVEKNDDAEIDDVFDLDGICSVFCDEDGSSQCKERESEDVDINTQEYTVTPASPDKCDEGTTSDDDIVVVRPPKTSLLLKANPSSDLVSDDSSDEDTGIYAETFRRSNWVRVSQERKSNLKPARNTPPRSLSPDPSLLPASSDANLVSVDEKEDDVFIEPSKIALNHQRSDSVTTTASEHEFKTRYMTRRKCLIQRADSQQEYHRLSARIYEKDKEVILERTSDTEDLGLHLLDSHPTYITSVDADSPAEKAGVVEGQIVVSVNDFNVLFTDHQDIIKLIQNCEGPIRLGVASTDFQPIRDLQAPVISGHMCKLGTSSLVRIWKKRFFVLRNDNCLYYYKSDQDLDPLGALPLCGYTISRHIDTSKDYCFKAEKYRARTYYFMTENRDQLTEWVAILTEAVSRSKKQKESSSFMSVSSHNVSLPALDIRRPECSGHLLKMSPNSRSWRRRYCLLKDACIYYYKDVNSFSALGVAHLHGYTVDVAGHMKKKNSFSLQPPDAKMRHFCFVADNDTDKKRWVEAIIHSIQRWVPVETKTEC